MDSSTQKSLNQINALIALTVASSSVGCNDNDNKKKAKFPIDSFRLIKPCGKRARRRNNAKNIDLK